MMRLTRLAIATAPAIFVLLWSTGFIGARYGLPYIEPLTFLAVRMGFVVLIMGAIALIGGAKAPNAREVGHALVAGSLVHGLYLGGVFTAISQGVPAGVSALIPGLQPILTSTIANRFMGETVTRVQWIGLALGLVGVVLVLHDRSIVLAGSTLGWIASFLSLVGITLGTLYQKRFCGGIDWRAGNFVQYVGAGILFTIGAFAFETREIHWTGELIFAIAWLVLVLSIAAIGLMYWLIRRSAATGFASLFYLVPAVTALFAFMLVRRATRCAFDCRHGDLRGRSGAGQSRRGQAQQRLIAVSYRSRTSCVWVTSAHSLPSLRVTRVCQTMVVRPRWSGVHSALATSPIGIAAKKLVLLSIVVVRLAVLEIGGRGGAAEIVGERHDGAAMHDVKAVVELLAHWQLGGDALAATRG